MCAWAVCDTTRQYVVFAFNKVLDYAVDDEGSETTRCGGLSEEATAKVDETATAVLSGSEQPPPCAQAGIHATRAIYANILQKKWNQVGYLVLYESWQNAGHSRVEWLAYASKERAAPFVSSLKHNRKDYLCYDLSARRSEKAGESERWASEHARCRLRSAFDKLFEMATLVTEQLRHEDSIELVAQLQEQASLELVERFQCEMLMEDAAARHRQASLENAEMWHEDSIELVAQLHEQESLELVELLQIDMLM
eukprot:TRINITY_DN101062_c0_g1_i1.p1 TRINITY_DN101062_c0_g1~~TRINITY_DN101062_c0_g1_i1.p1  ORF type:complete len:253 (-),score=30.33 TRINITY_DN101062_c0_g1_i1:271-1029(-)